MHVSLFFSNTLSAKLLQLLSAYAHTELFPVLQGTRQLNATPRVRSVSGNHKSVSIKTIPPVPPLYLGSNVTQLQFPTCH